jgi:hypothetical protein
MPLSYTSILQTNDKGKGVEKSFNDELVNPESGEIKKTDGTLKFRSKDFGKWMEANPKLKEFIYDMICDRVIMVYKVNEDFGIDDIIVDEDFISEDD